MAEEWKVPIIADEIYGHIVSLTLSASNPMLILLDMVNSLCPPRIPIPIRPHPYPFRSLQTIPSTRLASRMDSITRPPASRRTHQRGISSMGEQILRT